MPTSDPLRLNLTKASIERIKPSSDSRDYWYDERQDGLALCVTPAGQRTFYACYRFEGRYVRYRLGKYPDLTVEQARGMTKAVLGKVASGQDPQSEKQTRRGELTLGELFDHFLEHHAKVHKRTWAEDEKMFARYLESWRNRKLTSIKKSDLAAWHAKLGTDSGIYAANRVLGLVVTLFNRAADLGWEKPNPARGVKKFKERSRERFLHADEFPRFWQSLEAEPSQRTRDFIKTCLLTGARRGNILAMRWEQLNLDRAVWTIPTNKSGDRQDVHLVPEVVAILQERKQSAGDCPWVFPGKGKVGHLQDPTKPWKAILKRAGLADLRVHDLRRTLGSWQAATGASLPVIGKSLGHRSQQATAIYSRLDLDPVRVSVNTATAAMMEAAKPAEPKAASKKRQAKNGTA